MAPGIAPVLAPVHLPGGMTDPILPATLESTAHVVQVALSPVFLLSGIATLLNVFGARLARVSDQADRVTGLLAGAGEAERLLLGRRLDRLYCGARSPSTPPCSWPRWAASRPADRC